MSRTTRKPKLPRAPLPRQTEKVHSPRKKPLPRDESRDYPLLIEELDDDVFYHD